MIDLNRRSLIKGLVSFAVAAPAIVRAESLMPVKALILPERPYPARTGELWNFDGRVFQFTGKMWECTQGKIAGWPSQGPLPKMTWASEC